MRETSHGQATFGSGDPAAIADALEARLRAAATPERAAKERAYLKSDLRFLGAGVPAIRKAAVAVDRAAPERSRGDLFAVVEALWERGVHELRVAAVVLLGRASDRLEATDLTLLERLVRESRTWALVDPLATGPVAKIVEHDAAPTRARGERAGAVLDRWATDDDFWVRRAAMLALLPSLRRGEGDFERFGRYADAMLDEREFFVRKAIGWVLREVGKRDPRRVVAWLGPRTHRASGVTMREAVKYLPPSDRDALMSAYKGGEPVRERRE